MARTVEQLRNALSEVRATYGGQFAGQPRVTRSAERLQELLGQVAAVRLEAQEIGSTSIQGEATELSQAWTNELHEIRTAQAEGPRTAQSSSLAQWVRDSFERYQRHFAGQARSTRDVGLLDEIIQDLERRALDIDAHLRGGDDADLATTRETVLSNLVTYRREREQILTARSEGSLQNRAGLLARLANDQFARYRMHFAGKPRLSRRRGTLESIIGALQGLRSEMIAVRDAGVQFEGQQQNIDIVDGHLKTYHRELEQIRLARNSATRGDRIKSLAEAANAVFADYRANFPGHARNTRDEQLLSSIWEQLWPVALEMDELAREDDAEPVGSNLQKVRDSLRLYEREWRLIRQAKEGAAN